MRFKKRCTIMTVPLLALVLAAACGSGKTSTGTGGQTSTTCTLPLCDRSAWVLPSGYPVPLSESDAVNYCQEAAAFLKAHPECDSNNPASWGGIDPNFMYCGGEDGGFFGEPGCYNNPNFAAQVQAVYAAGGYCGAESIGGDCTLPDGG